MPEKERPTNLVPNGTSRLTRLGARMSARQRRPLFPNFFHDNRSRVMMPSMIFHLTMERERERERETSRCAEVDDPLRTGQGPRHLLDPFLPSGDFSVFCPTLLCREHGMIDRGPGVPAENGKSLHFRIPRITRKNGSLRSARCTGLAKKQQKKEFCVESNSFEQTKGNRDASPLPAAGRRAWG